MPGPVEVAVFNAAGFTTGPILETSVEAFEDMWRASALGGFLVGREAARRMVPRERGTILFTGASAAIHTIGERLATSVLAIETRSPPIPVRPIAIRSLM